MMAELIDYVELDKRQEADIREGGVVWLHDNGTAQDIKLEALAATKLFDFLLLHQDRLTRHAKELEAEAKQAEAARRYNQDMDARDSIIAESVEKPWLPLHDGE